LPCTPGVVAIVGRNGAGKSTLLKAASRHPSGGRIDGVDLRPLRSPGFPLSAGRGSFGWVPQRAETVFAMTVSEMVRVGRYRMSRPLRTSPSERSAVHGAWNSRPGGPGRKRGRHPERGRVAARPHRPTIVQDAPVLILDEPVASLDLEYQDQVYRLLAAWPREDDSFSLRTTTWRSPHPMRPGDRLARWEDRRRWQPWEVLTAERIEEIFG